MNILIVSGAFWPNSSPRSFRTTELAKELARQHHAVTIIAPLSKEANYESFKNLKINLINIPQNWKGVNKSNIPLLNVCGRIINRITGLFFEYPNIEFYKKIPAILKTINDKFDLLISIAVPHPVHWGVNKFLYRNPKFTKTWIADCGDPYMGCKLDTFPHPFYFKYFEKAFCARCDFITVPIDGAKESYYEKFRNKIKVIPQGFEIDKSYLNKKIINNDVITFAFAGSFFPGFRDPRPLLNYLTTINKNFKFHIFTKNSTLLKDYVDKLGNKLIIHSYLERRRLLDFLSDCDFLLNLENGTSVQSPSKVIDYAIANRPILSLDSKNMNYQIIEEFLRGDYSHQLETPDISKYDIKNVAKQFTDLAI